MNEMLFNLDDFTDFDAVKEQSTNGCYDACRIGDICESQFALDAKLQGFEIFRPDGHATKADIIIRKPGGRPIMIQIKKSHHHNGTWRVKAFSSAGGKNTTYKIGDFDVLAGYVRHYKKWIFLHLHQFDTHFYSWKPNNGQPVDNWEIFDQYFTTPHDRVPN